MIKNISLTKGIKTLFETQPEERYIISSLFLCNSSETDVGNIDVYAINSGDPISNKSLILKNVSLSPSSSIILNMEKMILENGDRIMAKSINEYVSATISVVKA